MNLSSQHYRSLLSKVIFCVHLIIRCFLTGMFNAATDGRNQTKIICPFLSVNSLVFTSPRSSLKLRDKSNQWPMHNSFTESCNKSSASRGVNGVWVSNRPHNNQTAPSTGPSHDLPIIPAPSPPRCRHQCATIAVKGRLRHFRTGGD